MVDASELAWDYSLLVDAYVHRPQYAESVVHDAVLLSGARRGDHVADMGAGVGHLTRLLLSEGLLVDAVEPNNFMRARGDELTRQFTGVRWWDATAESTGLMRETYALVTFGSSFNVVDQPAALLESAALLRPDGAILCCWNHRDGADPLQSEINTIIRSAIAGYDPGTREQDPSRVIGASGLFGDAHPLVGHVTHRTPAPDWLQAWRSHATLLRQAGARLDDVLHAIDEAVGDREIVEVPYVTRAFWAQRR